MKKSIFAVLIALSSQAFAGVFFKDAWEKDDCPKSHSLAWCVVKASASLPKDRYQIEDAKVSPEEFKALDSVGQQALQDAAVVTTGAIASYMSIYKMTAGAATSTVFGDGDFKLMLGMGLLKGLLFNGSEMQDIEMFAWLPTTQPFADAQVQFAKTYMNVVMDVMGFTKSEIVQLGRVKPIFGSEFAVEELAVEGGPCGASRCVLLESVRMHGYHKVLSGEYSANRENPPAFISSSPLASSTHFVQPLPTGYVTSSTDCKMNGISKVCGNRKYHRFPVDKLLQISEKLPSTVFIFVGIDPSVKDSIPVVLNQGRVLFFVTPKD